MQQLNEQNAGSDKIHR